MSSKFSTLLLSLGLGLAGCSLYEGPPPQKKKEMGQGRLGCLKDFRAKLIRYTEGKTDVSEVSRLAECSITALRTFGDLARGENKDRFTAAEIRNFFQRYFLDDVTITDELLREMMRVKQAIVGGQATDFTQADLKFAESLIETIRDVFIRLHPMMPITLERIDGPDMKYVDEVARAFIDAGDILGKKIVEQNSTYTFEEMQRLCDEIMRVFKDTAPSMVGIRDNLQLAGLLKEMVISPYRPRETITTDEWRIIFQDGSRWAGNLVKFRNLNAQFKDFTRGAGRDRLSVLVHESFDLMDRAIARHCPLDKTDSRGHCRIVAGVPIASLTKMLDEIEWDGKIGETQFEKSTLKMILPPFIRRILGGTDVSESGRGADRFTHSHLSRLRNIFREWVDGARYIEGAYAQLAKNRQFGTKTAARTDALLALDPRVILKANGGSTEAAVEVAEGLRTSIGRTVALLERNTRGILFDGKNDKRFRMYEETARYAWMRPVFKSAVLGYISGSQMTARAKDYASDGLTVEEFETMIVDYWQVLRDFHFSGPKNSPKADAQKRFREAALFTRVSDGNRVVSIDEGMQLIHMMLSTDPLSIETHDRLEAICGRGEIDDYNQPKIKPDCYRRTLYDFTRANQKMADLWKPFPILVKFYEDLSPKRKREFGAYLELASRKPGFTAETWFGSDDTQATTMMFHYIETVFFRFDRNQDGVIDQDEAEAALPIFRNTLADYANLEPDDPKVESVFSYLLAKGEPPVHEGMNGWNYFWRSVGFVTAWHWFDRDFRADRLSLVKVFSALASTPTKAEE